MATDTTIAKVVAVASSLFKTKAHLRHSRILYRLELNKLINEINASNDFSEVDGTTLLRVIILLGSVYLEKKGKPEMAEAALQGIMPLLDHLQQ